ncbi:MAG: lipoyl synthase [Kiritimatiellia bacterium]|nr:lipoyl synthase [Kiritimatiellia bacterium]
MTEPDPSESASFRLSPPSRGKPEWLRKPLIHGNSEVRRIVRGHRLHTVCEEAKCPNRHECWGGSRTATFMILGDVCTRHCGFCSVKTGRPSAPDPSEPDRVAAAVAEMKLAFVVITMVTRDDLEDGGAAQMAETVHAVRRLSPDCRVEVLPSDFGGCPEAIHRLSDTRPEVYGLNLETVRRLTPHVRSGSAYDRSLDVLRQVRARHPDQVTKSAMMLGLGELEADVCEALDDLRAAGVDVVAIGQYLQPTRSHLVVRKYWTPDEFASLREEALKRGFAHCEAGPWVRSSYRADSMYESAWAVRRGHG